MGMGPKQSVKSAMVITRQMRAKSLRLGRNFASVSVVPAARCSSTSFMATTLFLMLPAIRP